MDQVEDQVENGTPQRGKRWQKNPRRSVALGPELPMPAHGADAERDLLLLRSVMRNEALLVYERKMAPGTAAALAAEDIGVIGDIKDKAARAKALLSVRHSRQQNPDYQGEFTRLAVALAREADGARPPRNARAPTLQPPAPVAPGAPALRAKVAAFLHSAPDKVLRQYPDLAPAYGNIDAARKFAERNFPGHEQRFVDLAIEAVVDKIKRGEPILDPGLKAHVTPNGDRREAELSKPAGPQLVR